MKEWVVYVAMRVEAPTKGQAMGVAQSAANQVQTYGSGDARVTSAQVSSARRDS